VLEAYRAHAAERAALGIPPLPLTAKQTGELVALLKNPQQLAKAGEEAFLVDLLTHRVPAGVDDAAKVKAAFLAKVAKGEEACALISREKATELLGTMLGGYNVKPLIDLLDDAAVGAVAAKGLKGTLLMFDYFHDVAEKAKKGNANAKAVMQSGPTPSGSPRARKWRRRFPSPSSRSPARPTPTTSRPHPMPGAARTSRCTAWPC
jgi:aconitate hydratase 2/2-methylisocitrate dehydratase